MKCPKCHREKLGELQAVCVHCGNCEGNDRWYSEEDELMSIRVSD